MVVQGRIAGGAIIVDGEVPFPDGTRVVISLESDTPPTKGAGKQQRVQLPLVPSSKPGSVQLDGNKIAELLDGELLGNDVST